MSTGSLGWDRLVLSSLTEVLFCEFFLAAFYFPPKAGKYLNGLSVSQSVSHSVALSQKSMKALRDYVSNFSGYNF